MLCHNLVQFSHDLLYVFGVYHLSPIKVSLAMGIPEAGGTASEDVAKEQQETAMGQNPISTLVNN